MAFAVGAAIAARGAAAGMAGVGQIDFFVNAKLGLVSRAFAENRAVRAVLAVGIVKNRKAGTADIADALPGHIKYPDAVIIALDIARAPIIAAIRCPNVFGKNHSVAPRIQTDRNPVDSARFPEDIIAMLVFQFFPAVRIKNINESAVIIRIQPLKLALQISDPDLDKLYLQQNYLALDFLDLRQQ